jgi:hypothetical protein
MPDGYGGPARRHGTPPGRLRLVHEQTGGVLWEGSPQQATWLPDGVTVEVDGRRYRTIPDSRLVGRDIKAGSKMARVATYRAVPEAPA